jgi:hypothetical protein
VPPRNVVRRRPKPSVAATSQPAVCGASSKLQADASEANRVEANVCRPLVRERHMEQRAEGACSMTDDPHGRERSERLEDAERRQAAIAEIASGQVDTKGTAEMDLADAESRLNRIHDLARSSS